jgi:hypothetical protein
VEFDDENSQRDLETEQLELVDESDEESLEDLAEGEEQGEGEEQPDDEGQAEGDKRLSIFISYNQNPNDSRVADRIYAELSQHYDVFLDRVTIEPGQDYEGVTQSWLNKADFIIALISAKSVETLFMKAELQNAYDRYKQQGRPNVIPVQVAYVGPYGLRLSAYIGHFQAIPWDNENYAWLFERLHAGINNRLRPPSESLIVGTDILPISEALRTRWAKTFVEPPELSQAGELFEEKRLLWVTGDAGVRNYVALSLAARTPAKSLYEITRSRKWSEINNTNVSDSAIVLRDALPAAHLSEGASAIGEWHSLRAMIERNNIIIATSPDDEFERLIQELRRYEFTDYQHLRVGRSAYTDESKRQIFRELLEYMFAAREIDESKYAWAAELLKEQEDDAAPAAPTGRRMGASLLERVKRESRSKFRENIRKWTPSDIERFALSLSQVEKPSDISKVLQRSGAIEDEIRSWFLALDDSTRCFVLVLAIFPELNNDQLWDKYKSIVDYLRRFDPSLRLLPFGLCRRRAQPNVSSEGPIYLADERVAEAVKQEIAQSYREYFTELMPLLKDWSVPPDRNPKTEDQKSQRKLKIEEGKQVRAAIARIVGVVGRLGLDDLLEVLEYWATDPNYQIRKSVAVALEQAARSQTGGKHALNLLEKWCLDITSTGSSRWRALSAVIALGSITAAAADPYITFRALYCLRRFAKSKREDARFYTSIAIRQVVRHASLSAAEGILSRLAADKKIEVRLNVAAALNEAQFHNAEDAATLCEQWGLSNNEHRRWAALAALVTSRSDQNGAKLDKHQKLLNLLEHKEVAASLASVLSEIIKDDHHSLAAEQVFLDLVQKTNGHTWDNLAAGLATISPGKLENKLLSLLRPREVPLADERLFAERLIDIRLEVLKKDLGEPQRLLTILRTWLNSERARLEAYRALTLLLDDEPRGYQSEFVSAFAAHYSVNRLAVNQMLTMLEDLAPAQFAAPVRAVRQEAFRRLLQDPPNFVALVYEDLVSAENADDAREALEAFADDQPPGTRDELLSALAHGYAQSREGTRRLLASLRSSGSSILLRAVYAFNYQLVNYALAAPATLPTILLELIETESERGEVLSMLDYLAGPQSHRRAAFVDALVAARQLQAAGLDELLAHPALKEWANLATLPAEVARAFYMSKIFSVKAVRRLFRRK